jgi:hypothetical protein
MQEDKGGVTATQKWFMSLVVGLKKRNIAEQTGAANEQHYEVRGPVVVSNYTSCGVAHA